MKKTLFITAGLLALATLAWLQVVQPAQPALASFMPAGPMIYVEAKDFHSLLNEWNQSGVKSAWLASANYRVFSNSNLLQKLQGLYEEYGKVAGFLPGLAGTLEIAGGQSALGLYDLREQKFVYITRLEESQLAQSQLWRLRDRFTTRQASGVEFYLPRDDASNRTVAFAFTNGWLVLATRDDLIANTLALLQRQPAREPTASLAAEPWYAGALAKAGNPGELRMALNIQALISDVRFRSYWIQRNVSELRPFDAEIADIQRTRQEIMENRTLLRAADQPIALPPANALDAVAALRSLPPPDVVLTKAWAAPSPDLVASLIETRLLKPAVEARPNFEYAPYAVSTDESAGSEQDLETRIDGPPLSNDVTGALKSAAIRNLISRASPNALLQIESTARASGFIQAPSVLVMSAPAKWDAAPLREALSSAVETLWSTSRLGVEWRPISIGSHSAQQLNGLATLLFAIDGNRLYLANDSALLLATLNRSATPPAPSGPDYTAEFHHVGARADYMTIMQALDFGRSQQPFLFEPQGNRTPRFFSENVASLSSVFSFIQSMTITRVENQGIEAQRVVYR